MYYESQIWDKTICINLNIGKQDFAERLFQIYHHLLNMHHGSNLNFKLSYYCSEGLDKGKHMLHSNIEKRLNPERYLKENFKVNNTQ